MGRCCVIGCKNRPERKIQNITFHRSQQHRSYAIAISLGIRCWLLYRILSLRLRQDNKDLKVIEIWRESIKSLKKMNIERSDNVWFTPIDKIMIYESGKWMQYSNKLETHYFLRIHFNQLFITNKEKVLEVLSGKMKGFFKDDILILVVCNTSKEIRKLRFQLKTNELDLCIQKLSLSFPVVSHTQMPSKKVFEPQLRSIEEIFKTTIDSIGESTVQLEMPPNYEEFVKLCLLDPKFPQVVQQTRKIIEKITNST